MSTLAKKGFILLAASALCLLGEPKRPGGEEKRRPLKTLAGSAFRHCIPISHVSWSPDGNFLLTVGEDLRVWAAGNGNEVRRIDGAFCPRWTKDGRLAWFGGGWRAMDVSTGTVEDLGPAGETTEPLDVSPNLDLALGKSQVRDHEAQTVFLRAVSGADLRLSIALGAPANPDRAHAADASFSADGRSVVAWGADGVVRVYDTQSGACRRTIDPQEGAVLRAELSPDGNLVAAAFRTDYEGGCLYLWDVRSGERILALPTCGDFAFSADSKRFAWGHEHGRSQEIVVTDLQSLEHLFIFSAPSAWIQDLAFSPDGAELVAAGGPALRFWNLSTGTPVARTAGHTQAVRQLRFTNDGETLVSCGEDGTVRFWDVATGVERAVVAERDTISSFTLSPDGRVCVTGRENLRWAPSGSVGARSVPDGRLLWDSGFLADPPGPSFIVENGRVLITAGPYGMIWKRDLETGRFLGEFDYARYTRGTFGSAALSPDGASLATLEYSNFGFSGRGLPPAELMLWDVKTLHAVPMSEPRLSEGAALAWTGDGRHLLAVEKTDLWILDSWQCEEPRNLLIENNVSPDFNWRLRDFVAVTPDGARWLLAGKNGLSLYELGSGKPVMSIEMPSGRIVCFAISPDGDTFVTGMEDGRILFWSAAPDSDELKALDEAADWGALAGPDARAAYAAAWRFSRGGPEAANFLSRKLRENFSDDDLRRLFGAQPRPPDTVVGPRRYDPVDGKVASPFDLPSVLLQRQRAFVALARIPGEESTRVIREIRDNESWPVLRTAAARELSRREKSK